MDIENYIEIEVDPSVGGETISASVDKAGPPGLSAYEVAVKNGFVGTEEEWLASLKGEQGDKGETGDSGVAISNTQPTDESVNVWIDTSDGETVSFAESEEF